ncbi:MAG: hypothetical protein ACJATI_005468 [Halioglobus sp.]|jgi:uncharacterized protein YeeX (DUF496 family)
MITLNHQLKRLKEIHYRCYNNVNINDFLDLVHTLRIFSEYKEKINDVIIEGAEFESERHSLGYAFQPQATCILKNSCPVLKIRSRSLITKSV